MHTSPSLDKLSTVLQITDKLWQMGSGKLILHTHMTPVITLGSPSPFPGLHVPRESSYQCVEVTEGNANLTWGDCTLLFVFCLQWQGICRSKRRSTCLITTRRCALWHSGWCTADCCSLCQVQDQIRRGPWRHGVLYRAQRMEATGSGWACKHGNVLMHQQALLLWAGNTNLQMLNSWRSETTTWDISTHVKYYIVRCVLYIVRYSTLLDFTSSIDGVLCEWENKKGFWMEKRSIDLCTCFREIVFFLKGHSFCLMCCIFISCCGHEIEDEGSGAGEEMRAIVISKMQADRN